MKHLEDMNNYIFYAKDKKYKFKNYLNKLINFVKISKITMILLLQSYFIQLFKMAQPLSEKSLIKVLKICK